MPVAALVFVLAALAGASALAASPDVRDGPSPPAKAWAAAMEAGDLAALKRMHAENATAFPPDKTEVDGADAILHDYAALFAKYTVKVKDDGMHWIEVPPLIVSWGRSTMILTPKDGGATLVSHSRFTDAAILINGRWRYVVDHASRAVP